MNKHNTATTVIVWCIAGLIWGFLFGWQYGTKATTKKFNKKEINLVIAYNENSVALQRLFKNGGVPLLIYKDKIHSNTSISALRTITVNEKLQTVYSPVQK